MPCSESDDVASTALVEEMIGVWQITSINYKHNDGSSNTASSGCPTFNTIRFSQDGTYIVEDYEGDSADINNCGEDTFQGLWLLETDPENADNNFKIKKKTLNGQDYPDDWDYGEIRVSGDNLTIIYINTNWKTTENYREIL